jgi:hypothetical protein
MKINQKIYQRFNLSFEEFINKFYIEEGLTLKELAEKIETNASTLCLKAKELGLNLSQKTRTCNICKKRFLGDPVSKYCSSDFCKDSLKKEDWDRNKGTHKKARKRRGLNRKKLLIEKLGGKCNGCGETDLYKLCFHHKEHSKKLFTLDQNSLYQKKMTEIEKESEKCELYCHNCHAILHEKERIKTRVSNKYEKGRLRKAKLISLAGGRCEDCGFQTEFTQAMSFDHINPQTKEFELNVINLTKTGFDKIIDEFRKCRLLCMNCHIVKNKDRESNNRVYNRTF